MSKYTDFTCTYFEGSCLLKLFVIHYRLSNSFQKIDFHTFFKFTYNVTKNAGLVKAAKINFLTFKNMLRDSKNHFFIIAHYGILVTSGIASSIETPVAAELILIS